MYVLTNEDSRIYRNMNRGDLHNCVYRCNHKYFDKISLKNNDEYFICKSCKRSWFLYEKHPKRGNPSLEKYLSKCKHEEICTLENSTTHNKCLECDAIIEKSTMGKLWKNVRIFSEQIKNTVINKETIEETREEKISSGKPVRFVWDPELYADKMWDVEYDT